MGDHLVGHVSRDSTAIAAREKATRKPKPAKQPRKRGRPRKGESRPPQEPRRLTQQPHQSLAEMLAALPQACDVGTKSNSKGRRESWVGYKLHIDAADGGVPLSCVLTSASVHDSQVAIPLATMTASRVNNLYDLMDAAYDAAAIKAYSEGLGHVPIIDRNPRRDGALKQHLQREAQVLCELGMVVPEQQRYRERSTVERVNGRLKDEFGGRQVRVRGHAKVLVSPDVRHPGVDRDAVAATVSLIRPAFPVSPTALPEPSRTLREWCGCALRQLPLQESILTNRQPQLGPERPLRAGLGKQHVTEPGSVLLPRY